MVKPIAIIGATMELKPESSDKSRDPFKKSKRKRRKSVKNDASSSSTMGRASSKRFSILGTSDEERQRVATRATERRIGDAVDKSIQSSFRAHNAIKLSSLSNKTPQDRARTARILSAFGFTGRSKKSNDSSTTSVMYDVSKLASLDKDAQRKFRNEQRNIGRDIAATKAEIVKLAESGKGGNGVIENLQTHLKSLEALQRLMRRGNKVDGNMRYNSETTRLDAYAEYVENFKGRSARNDAKTTPRRIRPFVSEQMMKDRVANKMDVLIPEATDPRMEELEDQLSEAARRYDSAEMTRIVHEMIDYRNEQLYGPRSGRGPLGRLAATMRSRNFE